MTTFFMFGKYSAEALKPMSGERTKKAFSLIKKFGGEVKWACTTWGARLGFYC